MTYTDLVERISVIKLIPRAPRLFRMLNEIGREDDIAGKGLTAVLVVGKQTGKPGRGFFDLAKERGRDVSDTDKCQRDELQAVHDYWRGKQP